MDTTREEMDSGMDLRSNDYLDGINDMILLIHSADLATEEGRHAFMADLDGLEADMNDIRLFRFMRSNMVGKR